MRERYERLLRGYVEGVADEIKRLASTQDPVSLAWARLLQAAFSDAQVRESMPARGGGIRHPEAEPIELRTMLHGARRGLVEFDRAAGEQWLNEAAQLPGATECAAYSVERHLLGLETGLIGSLDYESLRAEATRDGDSRTVIALGVAKAWQAETEGKLDEALRAARRASRMARTESIPQLEYLAGVVLARHRRLSGRPHFASSILSSLASVVSEPWKPWTVWELLFSGDVGGAESLAKTIAPDHPTLIAVDGVRTTLSCAQSGRLEDFRAAAADLRRTTNQSQRLKADVHALLGVLTPSMPCHALSSLQAWRDGREAQPPRGLIGLAASATRGTLTGALVFVAARPKEDAARVLIQGAGLLSGTHEAMVQRQRRQGRLDTALAVLALAGPEGLELEAFFRRTYDFEFDSAIHTDAVRKLLARVDEWLAVRGNIEKHGSRIRLDLHSAILVADPRCALSMDVRVLGILATGATSAKQAARRLRVPLRTAQAALRVLVTEGMCQKTRAGNVVEYGIEDTTFSEPTRC